MKPIRCMLGLHRWKNRVREMTQTEIRQAHILETSFALAMRLPLILTPPRHRIVGRNCTRCGCRQ